MSSLIVVNDILEFLNPIGFISPSEFKSDDVEQLMFNPEPAQSGVSQISGSTSMTFSKNVTIYNLAFKCGIAANGDWNIFRMVGNGYIDWGDGSALTAFNYASETASPTHTYTSFNGTLKLYGDVTTFDQNVATASLTYNILDIPRNATKWIDSEAGTTLISGDVANLPTTMTFFRADRNDITGDIATIPCTGLTWLSIPQVTNTQIYGDIAGIPKSVLTYLNLGTNNVSGFSYTQGDTWAFGMRNVSIRYNTIPLTTKIIDDLLIDLAVPTWTSYLTIDVGGSNKRRSTNSDAALATLQGKGVSVTVNGTVFYPQADAITFSKNVPIIEAALLKMTTTSRHSAFTFLLPIVKTGSQNLVWTAWGTGITTMTYVGINPTWNFSANTGQATINITVSSPDGWSGATDLDLWVANDLDGGGSWIRTLDVTKLTALTVLTARYCQLRTLDLSQNTLLRELVVRGKYQFRTDDGGDGFVDISNNPLLDYLWADVTGIESWDFSNNPLIDNFNFSGSPYFHNQTNANQILAWLNAAGLSNGFCQISNGTEDNPNYLSYTDYVALKGKGWTLDFNLPMPLTVTDTVTFASTAAIENVGSNVQQISATDSFAFSNNVVLAGKGSIAATNLGLEFGQSCSVNGKGHAQGSAQIDFSQTVNIRAKGSVVASDSFLFSKSASLVGKSLSTGASHVVFSQTVQIQGKTSMSSAKVFTYTSTASIKGKGILAATDNFAFSKSVVIKGKATIVGVGGFVFSEVCSIESASSFAQISGSSSINFYKNAQIRGKGRISGTKQVSFSQSGSIKGVGYAVPESVPIIFSKTTSIKGYGRISSEMPLYFAHNSVLVGKGSVSASESFDFSSYLSLIGIGKISSSIQLLFNSELEIDKKYYLSGASALIFSEACYLGLISVGLEGQTNLVFGSNCIIRVKIIPTGCGITVSYERVYTVRYHDIVNSVNYNDDKLLTKYYNNEILFLKYNEEIPILVHAKCVT